MTYDISLKHLIIIQLLVDLIKVYKYSKPRNEKKHVNKINIVLPAC